MFDQPFPEPGLCDVRDWNESRLGHDSDWGGASAGGELAVEELLV